MWFGGLTAGYFVDIGAYDGVRYSNTLRLEQAGWKGLAIEPNPVMFEQLRRNRRCECLMACVGADNGAVAFQVVTGYADMLSGVVAYYDPRHEARIARELTEHGGTRRIIDVPSRRLQDLLEERGITRVDFLKIDTEGAELPILRSLDFLSVDIRVVAVENNYSDPAIPRLMKARGYKIHSVVGDEIYVKVKALRRER